MRMRRRRAPAARPLRPAGPTRKVTPCQARRDGSTVACPGQTRSRSRWCIIAGLPRNLFFDDMETQENESDLISCALYLQDLFKTCQGDAPRLKERIVADFRIQKYSEFVFHKVLDDNIAACKQAGYVNKEKVLNFLKVSLENEKRSLQASDPTQSAEVDDLRESLSTHHAPKFIDDEISKGSDSPAIGNVVSPESFIDASSAVTFLFPSATQNNKKKADRKEARRRAAAVAEKAGAHLQQHGWAVCDNFIPPEIVRRVRIEVRP